jgi:hypothetical protein
MVCIFSFNYPDAGRVAPISACVFLQRVSSNLKCNKNDRAFDVNFEHPTCKGKSITMCFGLLPDSSLCQNGKQVEIITKMIFELCYIEDNNKDDI